MEDINNELNKIIRKANKQQEFSEVNLLLDDNLEKLKNANTVLSFDMEFDNRFGNNVVEIGVAIYNKETQETKKQTKLKKQQNMGAENPTCHRVCARSTIVPESVCGHQNSRWRKNVAILMEKASNSS